MNENQLQELMVPIFAFLGCRTPESWLNSAQNDLSTLLIDHAHCEKKAASTALMLIQRYPEQLTLLNKMSRLAREELRHFEQVLSIMKKRGIPFKNITASRYAKGLREHCRDHEPARLIDTLIVGGYIEARSCERFYSLMPRLPQDIASFYRKLLQSEARHFEDYIQLAHSVSAGDDCEVRITHFRQIEVDLVLNEDGLFRFHSGQPHQESA